MPRYSKASKIEEEVWSMKLAGSEAATNRALVDGLFNGNPPFPKGDPELLRRGVNAVNTSFLEPTKIHLDAARQYSNAFLRPGNFFVVKMDRSTKHKRSDRSRKITTKINRVMKRSMPYRQTLRDKFNSVISHGIGPSTWDNGWKWCGTMQSMGDVLIPSRTLISMDGMNKFAVYRRYSAEQLGRMISGPNIDTALNVPLIKKAMEWAEKQNGMVTPYDSSQYNPERLTENFKENAGSFSSDQVPTVNCWDFYFLDDEDGDNYGWKRRIILDTDDKAISSSTKNILGGKSEFLYDSGDRNYARNFSEIIHFQYGSGATVAPARYHNQRGLGLLLYSICHLQNRLRCRFIEATFESMMQFIQGDTSNDEAAMLQKLALLDRGVLPPGFKFVGQNERWHTDLQLVQTAMQMNRQSMEDNSSSMTQDFDFAKSGKEKTATQYMGEASASQALVSSMLQEGYGYQEDEYREDCRRFCLKDSKDPGVREFRKECLSDDIPEECLDVNGWDVSADRVIGGGNKQMELAMVNMLMQHFDKHGPKQQRILLRLYDFAVTDDPSLVDELAPLQDDSASEGRHIAETGFASLMLGGALSVKSGIDERGFIEGLIHDLTGVIMRVEQSGGMATAEQILGFDTVAAKIGEHIAILAQDPDEKSHVRQYGDQLGELMNLVKAYKQRLQEQMQKQQEASQSDPETQAKVRAIEVQSQTKDAASKQKSAQAVSQKEEKFRQAQQHSAEKHQQTQQITQAKTQEDLTVKAAQAEQDLALGAKQAEHEMEIDKAKAEHEAKMKPKEGGESKATGATKSKKGSKKKITFERKGGVVTGATVEEE